MLIVPTYYRLSINNCIIARMGNEGRSLIRVLPACLKDPLPRGWDKAMEGYLIETMPVVDHPAAVPLSLQTTEPDVL